MAALSHVRIDPTKQEPKEDGESLGQSTAVCRIHSHDTLSHDRTQYPKEDLEAF